MKILKKNYKFILGIIVGLIIAGTSVYAATVIASSSISYDNTSSKLSSTNVKDALDELAKNTELKNRNNIIEGYTYNASTCVTGNESTCVKTTCYKTKTAGSCPAGTIIRYKVSDTDIVTFHVMYDNGTTMTMQSQKNTINNTMWISAADYATENTDGTSCGYSSCTDEGPMTALVALERATKSWTNVNDQTYTMGTTSLSSKGEFTGCSSYSSCAANKYTLDSRTAKARMITLQEANNLGCTNSSKSCPNWMNNYLYNSTSYGGTVSDSTLDPATGASNNGYWTMNANSSYASTAWNVTYYGYVYDNYPYYTYFGARAVVVVSK
ncbi:MAG: hypothetical protein J6A17_04410 [Bacilli bacterium]|nr:hypothetical protein [Bacilli bacterium]